MKMKNVLLVVFSFVVVQATNAAVLEVFNASGQTVEATIVWNGGQKSKNIFAGKSESLNSGAHGISRISWKSTEPRDPSIYYAPLSISNPLSLSHKFKILANGWYQFDNADSQPAMLVNREWDLMD